MNIKILLICFGKIRDKCYNYRCICRGDDYRNGIQGIISKI